MSSNEDLEVPVGSITIGEMISDLKDDDFPTRVSVPACFTFDAASKDDLVEFLACLWEGWDAEISNGVEGIAYDRVYLGWDDRKAYAEDATITEDW